MNPLYQNLTWEVKKVIHNLSKQFLRNSASIATDRDLREYWIPGFFRLIAIILGSLHTLAAITSYSMNADGINYLDIGDAYMRGDWHTAISSVWSPLYSWILGLVMLIVKPSMQWEFPVVHLVNFVIYLGAFNCFEFFWRQLMPYQQTGSAKASGENLVALPGWMWLALGYTLFIWSSLSLIQIWAVTPDMLMAAFVYLAAGLVVRIRIGSASWGTFVLLGVVLGLGYLAKAAMFPLALIFLGISLFSVTDIRRAIPQVLIASVVFLLLTLPFIALMSQAKGRLTFGDAGKLTYVRYVNRLPYPHWQGNTLGNGAPVHPSRKILDTPPVYEFGTPVGGTYPISFDPAYWYEGVIAHFDWKQQTTRLLSSVLFYLDLFFQQQGTLTAGVLILYLMGEWKHPSIPELVQRWGLVLPALAAFVMYALVLVEGRYIGVFVLLFWADLLANVRLAASRGSKRLVVLVGSTMILFMLLNIAAFNLNGYRDLVGGSKISQLTSNRQAPPPSWPGEVAEVLHRLGIKPGDKVAVIGYGFDSFWARLARVQIVAEMLDLEADPFWLGDSATQSKVIQAFAHTGAKAIVAEYVPGYASLPGWRQVNHSNYYIYIIE